MTAPYASYSYPARLSKYSFSTSQGKAVQVSVPTARDLSSYAFSLEVDKNSRFPNPITTGSVEFVDGKIMIAMSSTQVDELRGGVYRVKAVKDDASYFLVEGSFDYQTAELDEGGLLDITGQVRVELLPPLVDALDDVFLRREEYVAGVVDPAVLDAAVQNKLAEHVNSATPHPAYDIDAPSFKLLFENGLI